LLAGAVRRLTPGERAWPSREQFARVYSPPGFGVPGALKTPMTEPVHSSNSRLRFVLCGGLLALVFGLLAAGCGGSTSSADKATEQEKAQQLVSAAHASGLAPHLTVDIAEALYGKDAAGVCDVFKDGLTTAERNDLLGNSANRRPKTITTNAIDYGRLVVKTYCPDELSRYNGIVDDLNPVTSSD
jgi:hypothetical protein